MRAIAVCAAIALLAFAASAEPAVPQDLLAVLTLRGKPCGSIASAEAVIIAVAAFVLSFGFLAWTNRKGRS